MLTLIRRFRGPLVAVVAVIFSASVVMAAQPASPGAAGLAKAATHTSQTTTVKTGDEQGSQDETTETDESTDTTDPSGSADNCTTDPNTVDVSTLTHGQVVCWAAHQPTPDGFANHGAWVKSWAKQNHGADASATGKGHKPTNLPSH